MTVLMRVRMGDQGGSFNSIASSNLTVPLLPSEPESEAASPAGSLDPTVHARSSHPAAALPTVGEEDEDVPATPDAQ